MALVDTRNRTFPPSAWEMKVTLHRFGRNRRLVLIFEWLTLWPTSGPLAVSSQRRDIVLNPLPSRPPFPFRVRCRVENHVHPGHRGRIGGARQGVKVCSPRQAVETAVFAGIQTGLGHHINGVFADDIIAAASVPAIWRGFVQKAHQLQLARTLLAKPVSTPGSGRGACFCGARVVCRIFLLK